MPLFTLPIHNTSSAFQPRLQFSSLPVRNKRKRTASPRPSLPDDEEDDEAKSIASRSEAAASTNPLSLTQAEVVQYRLAGLELDEEIPDVKGWPHRGLPSDQTFLSKKATKRDIKGKGKESIDGNEYNNVGFGDGERDDIAVKRAEDDEREEKKAPRLRLQHFAVLAAILQRCLLDGDIPRASRAWAMLIRAQFGGQGIDLRGSGYWAIGSDDDGPRYTREDEAEPEQRRERRWGSADGLEKTKEYYERLILQHPYKRQFHGSTSALDFWPVMVGCEIYGIQYEHTESLRELTEREYGEDDETVGSESDFEPDIVEGDNIHLAEERKKARRRQKRAELRWQERDEIREAALVAYEKLAARLDELMTAPPYSDSHVLLRIRGMLALCIGDLSVPALPVDEDLDDEDEEILGRKQPLGIGGKDIQRRFLARKRQADNESGKKKQQEEHKRARNLFERIERESGRKESVMDSLPGDDEDVEEFYDTKS